MNKLTRQKLVVLLVLMLACRAISAEGVVVVHPDNQSEITELEIRNIFLGNRKTFSNGQAAFPVVPKDAFGTKVDFYRKVIRKNNAQYHAYWARRLFTGEGKPPRELDTDELINEIASNPNAIGVTSKDSLKDQDAKIVLDF